MRRFIKAVLLILAVGVSIEGFSQGKKGKKNNDGDNYRERYGDHYDDRFDDRYDDRYDDYDYDGDRYDRYRYDYYEGRNRRNGKQWNAIERRALEQTKRMDRILRLSRSQERRVARINIKYATIMANDRYASRGSRGYSVRRIGQLQRRKDNELRNVLSHRQFRRYMNMRQDQRGWNGGFRYGRGR